MFDSGRLLALWLSLGSLAVSLGLAIPRESIAAAAVSEPCTIVGTDGPDRLVARRVTT